VIGAGEAAESQRFDSPNGRIKKKGSQHSRNTPTTMPRVLAAFFSLLNLINLVLSTSSFPLLSRLASRGLASLSLLSLPSPAAVPLLSALTGSDFLPITGCRLGNSRWLDWVSPSGSDVPLRLLLCIRRQTGSPWAGLSDPDLICFMPVCRKMVCRMAAL